MGGRRARYSAQAPCGLGGWALGKTRPRVGLVWGPLAVKSLRAARSGRIARAAPKATHPEAAIETRPQTGVFRSDETPPHAPPQTMKNGMRAAGREASWTAAVPGRSPAARPQSARGLAHSKSFARSGPTGTFGSDAMPQAPPETMKMVSDADGGPGQRSGKRPRNTPNTRKRRGASSSVLPCSPCNPRSIPGHFPVRRHAAPRGATSNENGSRRRTRARSIMKHFASVFSVPSVAFSVQTPCRARHHKG